MSDTPYWLGFSLVAGIGSKRIRQLHEQFGSLEAAWKASDSHLRHANLGTKAFDALMQARRSLNLEQELEKVRKAQAWLLLWTDERYPANLRHIDDPPALLYVRGTLTPSDERAIAIVGTRKAT